MITQMVTTQMGRRPLLTVAESTVVYETMPRGDGWALLPAHETRVGP